MKGSDTVETVYTIKEVAVYLKVDEKTVRNWIDEKKITTIKIGRLVRIRESDLQAFMASKG